jgi:predicted amidohydrolase YtcJ
MNQWLLRRASVGPDRVVDLAVSGGRLVDPSSLSPGYEELDLEDRPVLAGLVDQHLHLRALAASWHSVDCSPDALVRGGGLGPVLTSARQHRPEQWLRGIDHDPTSSGELVRWDLDRIGVGPVRVQDRSGVTWTLDSLGLAAVLDDDPRCWPDGVERDASGVPTGRLHRLDAWLGARVPRTPVDLAAVGRWLAGRGVTTLVDASATNGAEELAQLGGAGFPQRLVAMTGGVEVAPVPGVELGPVKVMLDDVDLPPLDVLAARVSAAHRRGRAVAVHCVSTVQLVLALTAGLGRGDRIEHGSVVPDDVIPLLAASGATVVAQPGLVRTRGDRYLSEVEPDEVHALHRLGALRRAGIPVAVGSDAPYGPADPWVHVAAAVDRLTAGGVRVGADEGVDVVTALSLLQRGPAAPYGPRRSLRPGGPADLCVLDTSWRELVDDPAAAVHATWIGGAPVA